MNDLERSRAEIDRIDAEMTALFERRMQAVAEIAAYKRENGLPVADPAREKRVLLQNERRLHDPALRPFFRDFLQHTLALSRQRQIALSPPSADGLTRIPLELPGSPCALLLGPGLLHRAGELLPLSGRRVLIVTDDGVPAQYAQTLAAQCADAVTVSLPQGEANKTLAQYERLLTALLENGFCRTDCVVALGGGLVCDLAGFAAATYLRGVDFCSIPTTLLAQVDAAVGGKNGCNLGGVKNQLGTIRQPNAVLIDPDLLNTLPPRQRSNGLAEALKAGVIGDPALFSLLETGDPDAHLPEIIERALRVKCRLVAQDEHEQGARRLLNLGHTLGHGLEAVTGLLHGECVALGMLAMSDPELKSRLLPVLKRLGLPMRIDADPEAVLAAALHDKKIDGGRIRIVTARDVGCCQIETVPVSALRDRLFP